MLRFTCQVENSCRGLEMLLKLRPNPSRFQRLASSTSQATGEQKEKQADKLYHVVKDMVHQTKCMLGTFLLLILSQLD